MSARRGAGSLACGSGAKSQRSDSGASHKSLWMGVLVLLLALGGGAHFVVSRAALAQPSRFQRTPEQLAHEQNLLVQMAGTLESHLEMAERFERIIHLDQTAAQLTEMIPETLATDPYRPEERAHLEEARREVQAYLAPADRRLEALRQHFGHIRRSLEAFRVLNESLTRDKEGGQ